jgi:hypothetical protein|nr:MAG TPA: hypothetical protein [Caudoviricetes sp.]
MSKDWYDVDELVKIAEQAIDRTLGDGVTTLRLAKYNNLFNDMYVIERAIARLLNDNESLKRRLADGVKSIVGEDNSVLVTAIMARILTSLMIDAQHDYNKAHHNKYSNIHLLQCSACRREYYDLRDEQRLEAKRDD